jgi:ABC-type dipeptide/oligopeptide/nickel transport system permease subunit
MLARLRKNALVVCGFFIILFLLVMTATPGLFSPHDPIRISLENKLIPPGAEHLLGTDSLGRDLLCRIVHGARISVAIGISCVLISSLLGVFFGVVAGYYGSKTDEIIMRVMDLIMSFPSLILAMVIAASLGPGVRSAVYAVAFVQIPGYARIARSSTLYVKEQTYVAAAISLGDRTHRIIFVHILPNILSPLVVQATLGLGSAILTVAGLSFLGLGAQAPTPEWGQMISEGRSMIVSGEWWVPTFPGLAIMITVMSFNFIGDGLRDILDPRLRGK